MDFGKNISFIPKKPLTRKVDKPNRPVSILLVLSYFIFFTVIASYGGLYFYNKSLKNTLAKNTKELEIEKSKADPSSAVEEGEKLQKQINSVKDLLNNHVALSTVFEILEGVTLKSITLQEFSLEQDKPADGSVDAKGNNQTVNGSGFVIKTKGIAPSYGSLAYQSDVLKKEVESGDKIKSFSIDKPILDESGNISFNLDITVDSQFLLYKKKIDEEKQLLQKEIAPSDGKNIDSSPQVDGTESQVSKVSVDENVVSKDKNKLVEDIPTKEKYSPSIFEKFINFFKKYK